MRSRRKTIMFIIIILIIALGIGSFVFAYITTDFLKTNKQLFYRYLSQVVDNIESLENEQIISYLNKKEENPYETKGNLKIKVEVPGLEEYINTEKVNNLNITFDGKRDKINKISEYNFNINYSDNISFPIKYKQENDLYGIKSDLVVNRYMVVKNQEIYNLLKNMDISEENIIKISNIIDRINNKVKIEDIKGSLEGIDKKIIGEKFSKTQEGDISLSLNKTETEEIIEKILEGFNIISQNDKLAIINIIKNIEVENPKDEFLEIIINKDGKINIKIDNIETNIELQTNKTSTIIKITLKGKTFIFSIGKVEEEGKIEYTLTGRVKTENQREIEVYLKIGYFNIEASGAKEIYSFGIYTNQDDEKIQYSYEIEEDKNFLNEISLDRLENENTAILNEFNKEDIIKIIQALKFKIEQINKIQMQRLGLNEDQNPLIYAIPVKYMDMLLNPIEEDIEAINERKEKEDEQIQIRAFNVRFENYQGTQQASSVKTLVSSVISNNLSNKNLVSVNGMTNQTDLTNFMNGLKNDRTYIITIGISEKGYINTIQVN